MTKEDRKIVRDRMRYTKNKLSSTLAIAAIVFNVFYFVSIYKSDVGTYYYQILVGADIVYNLLFMLIAFLSSEGVKNYKMGYSFVLLIIGVLQVGRILLIPMQAHEATITVSDVTTQVMSDKQFMWVVAWLALSALCCVLAAITSFCRNCALASHMKALSKEKAA